MPELFKEQIYKFLISNASQSEGIFFPVED
jgi:hypothetical protein